MSHIICKYILFGHGIIGIMDKPFPSEKWQANIFMLSWTCVYEYMIVSPDDVVKWKPFPRHWSFVRWIHWSPVNSPHKGQWRGALMFSLICALNKRLSEQSWGWWFETLRAHYDVIVMKFFHVNAKGYMEGDDYGILVSYVEKSISQIFIFNHFI